MCHLFGVVEELPDLACRAYDIAVDDKFVKERLLERLSADVQTILEPDSQDLTVSQPAEMADRMMEVQRFQSPSVAQISSSSSSVNEHLMKQVSAMANEMASLKLQLARLTSSRSRNRRRPRSRPRTADTSETGKSVSQIIDVTVYPGSSGSGRTFYVCDFHAEFDLLVDCRRACLLDRITGLFVRGLTPFTAPTYLSVLDTDIGSPFRQLILRHPNMINRQFRSGEVQHDLVHHIHTPGPSVFTRPRLLAPERFQAAKAGFKHMLQLRIILPSENPWASPLQMVPKATSGDWGPCGDYRAVNSVTIPDRYPMPHLQDFAGALFGKAVSSKIDLVRAFHQIPVATDGVPKTAVTTPFGLFEFVCVPFGLGNAAQTFQRFVDHVLRGLSFVKV
nr:unnamed protein product [Spirometra erinaceieuropaei]